jgi:hypothetical protein
MYFLHSSRTGEARMKWGVDRDLFSLWIEHGLVIGSKTWSETHVSGGSSGGGGFVSGGSGYISAPNVTVTSSVRTRNSFFLKAADGKERSVDIDGALPLRDGQTVSVVYVKRTTDKLGYALVIHNHTTGEVTELPQGFDTAAGKIGCVLGVIGVGIVLFVGGYVAAFASVILRTPALSLLLYSGLLIGAIYLLWQRSSTFKVSRAQLFAEARTLAEQAGAGSTLEKEGT